ncbi:MAG: hypothetical protein WCX95_03755 [Candidatus Gracilibacteria bacterium]
MENPVPYEENGTSPIPYFVVLAAAIIAVVYFYGIKFDDYSETELVNFSYYFVPAFAFSIVGLITKKNKKSLLYAIGAAVSAGVLLVAFFMGIWPSL